MLEGNHFIRILSILYLNKKSQTTRLAFFMFGSSYLLIAILYAELTPSIRRV